MTGKYVRLETLKYALRGLDKDISDLESQLAQARAARAELSTDPLGDPVAAAATAHNRVKARVQKRFIAAHKATDHKATDSPVTAKPVKPLAIKGHQLTIAKALRSAPGPLGVRVIAAKTGLTHDQVSQTINSANKYHEPKPFPHHVGQKWSLHKAYTDKV